MTTGQPSGRLTSWKEIAHYLQCEERTAQRWEQERGLPVRRIPGEKRGSVFAFRQEIDAWLAQQSHRSEPVSNEEKREQHPTRRWTALRVTALAGTSILILVSLFSLAVWLIRSTRADVRRPAAVSYSGPFLIVSDSRGNELWRYRFPSDLAVPGEAPEPWRHTRFVDLEGDGSVETLAAVGFLEHSGKLRNGQTELICFSSDGEVRWRFAPKEDLSFRGTTYSPPYSVSTVLVQEKGGERSLWVAFVHNTWWPTILVKLDTNGRELARFVNAGYIYTLAELTNVAGHFILAAGVNNEYDSGMLAVLRAGNPTGASPQTPASAYDCQSCMDGNPHKYFVFPRSELNRLTPSPYNKVVVIDILENRVKVMTREVDEPQQGNAEAIFEFSHDFELLLGQPSDSYWNLHRALEHDGKVQHSASNCPDKNSPPVPREWREGSWYDLPPRTSPQQTHTH